MLRLMRSQIVVLSVLFGLAVADPARADETETVAGWLSERIIDPQLPLQQVRDFTVSRVPLLPELESREQWQQYADQMRKDAFEKVIFRGEAARWRELPTQVEYLGTIETDHGYRIRKLRYEAVPGMWIPALLYEPDELDGKVPVVLNVNGHDRNGMVADYKQIRCINQVKRGMIALNVEWVGMGQLRSEGYSHYRMNQLDLCGTSGLAPFYLSLSRAIDVLLQHDHADTDRVAVTGLSGGGCQTILISSFDERVTLANPGRRLLQLRHPRAVSVRPGGLRADAQRPGECDRLRSDDGDAGPPADAADVQRPRPVLFPGRPRPAPAACRGETDV